MKIALGGVTPDEAVSMGLHQHPLKGATRRNRMRTGSPPSWG